MRIAFIADIHGNLTALQSALDALQADAPDQIVFLGDAANDGPYPREVLDVLRSLNCAVVRGNHDDFMLNPQIEFSENDRIQRLHEAGVWCAEQLTDADLAYIRSFQATIELEVGDTKILCYHGSPRSNTELVIPSMPDDVIEEIFGASDATLFVGGHIHVQMLRSYKKVLLLNPGAIGLAWYWLNGITKPIPYAHYALVDINGKQLDIQFRRIPYDSSLHFAALRTCGIPHADWLISLW